MRHLAAWFREITRTYDRLLNVLERRSVVLFSKRRFDIAGSVDSAKAYLKKRARRLQRRVTSLASKAAAKTTATTSR